MLIFLTLLMFISVSSLAAEKNFIAGRQIEPTIDNIRWFGKEQPEKNFIATLQIKRPSSKMIWTYFYLYAKGENSCKTIAEHYWRGMRTTCEDCIKEFDECLTYLPAGYKEIEQNKPIVFPYLSSKAARIVIWGVPMNEAKETCKQLANEYRKGLDPKAICIMPSYTP